MTPDPNSTIEHLRRLLVAAQGLVNTTSPNRPSPIGPVEHLLVEISRARKHISREAKAARNAM